MIHTLSALKGAAYSSELIKPVSIRTDVPHSIQEDGATIGKIKYYVGESVSLGYKARFT